MEYYQENRAYRVIILPAERASSVEVFSGEHGQSRWKRTKRTLHIFWARLPWRHDNSKFHFISMAVKINYTYRFSIYDNAVRFDFYQNSLGELATAYNYTFKQFLNSWRQTSSCEVFALRNADHVKWCSCRKSSLSFMTRVTHSSNAVTRVVFNGNAWLVFKLNIDTTLYANP